MNPIATITGRCRDPLRILAQPSSVHVTTGKAYGSAIEKAIAFVLWMQTLESDPQLHETMMRFDLSRATAYRWMRIYHDAIGQT